MKRITFLEAAEPPHFDFVLPGMLAGTVGMIVGRGAVGKSFLALHIGISVALGKPACTGMGDALWPAPASGPVAIVMGEDIPDVVHYRLHELRAALSPDDLAQIDEELDVQSWTDEQDDLRVIQRQPGGLIGHGPFYHKLRALAEGRRLVILDPLAFLHDCDENDNGDMTKLMRALGGIARAT
jgi:RecA-family ATPase